MEKMSFFEKICIILYMLIFQFLLFIFKIIRRVKIHGSFSEITDNKNGILVISNHPSIIETYILIPLFRGQMLKYGYKGVPVSVPKKGIWLFNVENFIVRIDKDSRRHKNTSLFKMIKILKQKRSIIIFPEGTRTSKGVVYKSKNSVSILNFSRSLEILCKHSENILPVKIVNERSYFPWVTTNVYIGEIFKNSDIRGGVVDFLENKVLDVQSNNFT